MKQPQHILQLLQLPKQIQRQIGQVNGLGHVPEAFHLDADFVQIIHIGKVRILFAEGNHLFAPVVQTSRHIMPGRFFPQLLKAGTLQPVQPEHELRQLIRMLIQKRAGKELVLFVLPQL